MKARLFRNFKTERQVQDLACLAYHYDKRGETNLGLDLLKTAGICPMSADFTPAKRQLIKTYVDHLKTAGFITLLNKGYHPRVSSRTYRVNKETIVNYYGEIVVHSYKDRLLPNDTPTRFIEKLDAENFSPDNSVTWTMTGPMTIEFSKNGKLLNTITYRNHFGKQPFQYKSFHGLKEALEAFVKSFIPERLPEDVESMITQINEGEEELFKKDFPIHLKVKESQSGKSFTVTKSTRSYSSFCSYKKVNGDRQRTLNRFGLTKEFDIKSAVPRVTYLLNKGLWLDNSVDLYEAIFLAAEINRDWNSKLREAVKDSFMRMYFMKSQGQSWNSYKRAEDEKVFTEAEYRRLFTAVRTTLGGSYGSEIFLWESILETQVVWYFKQRGHRIVNIYDGFYFQDDLSHKEVENYIAVAAMDLLKRKQQGQLALCA